MESTKIPFFKRLKKAVIDFESYSDFAVEKIDIAIKYFAKLMIIFSLIVAITFTYKFSTVINNEEQLQITYNELADTGMDLKLMDDVISYVKNNRLIAYVISSFCVDVIFADGFPVASYLPSASKNVNSHKIYIFLILLQKIPPLGTFTQNIC